MARSPSFMVVSPERGFKSLKDLVAYARAQPLGVHYASAGVGSTAHLHAAAVAQLAGIKAEHVAQRGTPEAVNDAMAGRVLYAFAPGPNAIPLAKSGKLQILATTSPRATASWRACRRSRRRAFRLRRRRLVRRVRPAGTPLAIRSRVATRSRASSRSRSARAPRALGAEPAFMGPEEFAAFAQKYVADTRSSASRSASSRSKKRRLSSDAVSQNGDVARRAQTDAFSP
jgi:tripartite-type tricarboxylate transporter receptor subunit TctC